MNRIVRFLVSLMIAVVATSLVTARAVHADTVDSQYEIKVFSGLGLQNGEASLAIFFKPASGRSQRVPYTRLFGREGRSQNQILIEVDDIPVEKTTYAVAISGSLKMGNQTVFYIPIKVEAFEERARRDLLHNQGSIKLTTSRLTAFRRSYPFSTYECDTRMDKDDLEKVILASRAMLTERDIYLSTDEGWNCLENFFEANASIMSSIDPARLNDVLEFLANYRSFQEDVPERFIGLYLQFLKKLIALNIMGTELADDRTLESHLRSELREIFAEDTTAAVGHSGGILETLDRLNAPELCLDLAGSLFFNFTQLEASELKALDLTRPNADFLVEYAMNTSMDCAVSLARREDVDLRTLGPVASTSAWLTRDYANFMQTYINLYDHLDQNNWISQRKVRENTTTARVHDNYLALVKAFPRPRLRPERPES